MTWKNLIVKEKKDFGKNLYLNNMKTKAIIVGVKKFKLTEQEKKLFKSFKPWGVILFSRNIKNKNQLKLLTDEIRKIFNNKRFPIMIDQEGGKVSRLNEILDFTAFSQTNLKNMYKGD